VGVWFTAIIPEDQIATTLPSGPRERTVRVLRPFVVGEDAVHYLVALLLFAIAGVVLYETVTRFTNSARLFPDGVTEAVNGVLFVVIIMEILRTVLAHFEGGGFQLKPFLVIGIISAVRHILTVGANLTLAHVSVSALHDSLLELGVNAAVVLALVVALVLVRRTETETMPPTDVTAEP
jgi:uncharacterized membrane protein (DUF373 family)